MLSTNLLTKLKGLSRPRVKRLFSKKRARRAKIAVFTVLHRLRSFPFVKLDSILVVQGKGLLVQGLLIDPSNQINKLELLFKHDAHEAMSFEPIYFKDGQLRTQAIPEKQSRKPGFACLAQLPYSSAEGSERSPQATGIRITLSNGRCLVRRPRKSIGSVRAGIAGVRQILDTVPVKTSDKRQLFDTVYGPAIDCVWSKRDQSQQGGSLVAYNAHLKPEHPDVTLVIPIYGRFDFIEYQLSSFCNDRDMYNHEILFVIDDPSLVADVKRSCETLKRLYKISFNILYLECNLGYAGANNAGVRAATAENILLLNSDVMPIHSGWLAKLLASTEATIDKTLCGVRLLYEDNSVQHDGMAFFASPFVDDLWTNIHPGKGLPADIFSSHEYPVQRQAVTGACLLIKKSNYEKIGGLDERYILGDFEDSDLCMRARQHGLDILLAEDIVLYHLERQSQSLVTTSRWKQELTYYNCWQHTQLWDDAIRKLQPDAQHD